MRNLSPIGDCSSMFTIFPSSFTVKVSNLAPTSFQDKGSGCSFWFGCSRQLDSGRYKLLEGHRGFVGSHGFGFLQLTFVERTWLGRDFC